MNFKKKPIKIAMIFFYSFLSLSAYSVSGDSNIDIDIDSGQIVKKNASDDMSDANRYRKSIDYSNPESSVPIDFDSVTWQHGDFSSHSPNTLTYKKAVFKCDEALWDSEDSNKRKNVDTGSLTNYQYWVACMKGFFPFVKDKNEDSLSCGSVNVTWGGNCKALIGEGNDFDIIDVHHESSGDEYQGVASFECINNKWKYVDGTCLDTPDICGPDPTVIEWPVTSPSWAVQGNVNESHYDPKPNCATLISGEYLSGTLLTDLTLTAPPMGLDEIGNYDSELSTQNTYFRCFNGEWLLDETKNPQCVYHPKSCSEQNYVTSDGCTFQLPEIPSGQNVTVTSPFPDKSTGYVTASCFDGNIEIVSESCQLSCINQRSANSWTGKDVEACSHPVLNSLERTAPDSILSIENTNDKMSGEYSWKCNDGFFEYEGKSCFPNNCNQGVPANNYVGIDLDTGASNTCSHPALTDTIAHNNLVSISTNSVDKTGSKHYRCSYGTLTSSTAYQDTCTAITSFTCTANTELHPDPSVIIDSTEPSCQINCRADSIGSELICKKECDPNPNCDCFSPCGQNGTELTSTGGSCSYKATCDDTNSALCDFNDGTEYITTSCSSGNWIESSVRCEPYTSL